MTNSIKRLCVPFAIILACSVTDGQDATKPAAEPAVEATQNGVDVRAVPPVQEINQMPRPTNHVVRLAADGLLPGRIRVFDPSHASVVDVQECVIQFVQQGEVRVEVIPGVAGTFQVPGLTPGWYSVIASGPFGYVAYGVYVAAHSETDADDLLQIESLAVPPVDYPLVVQLIQTYVPRSFLALTPVGAGLAPKAGVLDGLPVDARDSVDVRTGIETQFVEIDADGNLPGTVRAGYPVGGGQINYDRMKVFLIKGNSIAAHADVDKAGSFTFQHAKPGYYSFVAVGPVGFAAFGIDAVLPDEVAVQEVNGQRLFAVAFDVGQPPAHFIDAALISPRDLAIALRNLLGPEFEPGQLPMGPMGFAGGPGVGGGGAGGFGGGLLSGLLGGAIAGGIIAAADDDGGNTVIVTTPVTPMGP